MIKSFEILTIFPDFFKPFLTTQIMERAREKVSINLRDLRDYAEDKRRTVDDTPYGGGPGMILKCEPMARALEDILKASKCKRKIIFLTPQGKIFNHEEAQKLKENEELVLICGRYEGIDQRIVDEYVDLEISVGDFILSGGELPAMIVMESVLRLIPGVLGNEQSYLGDSFTKGIFSHPQYTRPEEFKGKKVPEVLLSGNHQEIKDWRLKKALEKTKRVRPDLYDKSLKKS